MATYQKQIESLLDELREKSDSESFDDEKTRLLNVQKALEGEQLKKRLASLQAEVQIKAEDAKQNLARLEGNLKFSQDANTNLKNDYDLL